MSGDRAAKSVGHLAPGEVNTDFEANPDGRECDDCDLTATVIWAEVDEDSSPGFFTNAACEVHDPRTIEEPEP